MRTPEKHFNNRNMEVNIKNRNSLTEMLKIVDDEDLTSREESTAALDGAPVSGTTRNGNNLWPDLFDDVCEIKPWNESKVAR
uniref:Uncharacterized protein n=1 Tax=Romanomermis culicivorax TaxID=13658 RepID=A0A915I8Z8_ROMCU